MKTLKAILFTLFAFMPLSAFAQLSGQVGSIPGLPTAGAILATAGPQARADGQAGIQLADREGNTKATAGHADYTEITRRGKVFTLANASYTILAQNASGGAIGTAKPIVGFYNPTGSGVNAMLINEEEWHASGTPGGPLIFNFYCGQNWTSVSSGTVYNNLLSNNTPNGSQMIAQNNQNVNTNPAITSALLVLQPAGGPSTVAIATGTGETGHSKDLRGLIAVPPGCFFGLFSTATGTNDAVSASLSWEEVSQ